MSQLQPAGPAPGDALGVAVPSLAPRNWAPVVVSGLVAAAILLLFARVVPFGEVATFRLTAGRASAAPPVAPLVVPARAMLLLLAALAAAAGAWAYTRPERGGLSTGFSLGAFVIAFLVWAAAGKSFNLLAMLQSTLVRAVPITLAALSGVMCERSGVINIAIEGMMLTAAFTAVVAASVAGSLWMGLTVGLLTGALLAWAHAVLAIKYRVDQIVSGTVINIFAVGITSYLSARFLQVPEYAWMNNSGTFPAVQVPLLNRIPVLGPLFFEGNLFFFLALALVIGLQVVLFRTRFGLRVRSVGEHPRAADTLGIDVNRVRYVSVILGGMLAGLGGAYFTIGSVGRFDEQMTAGRGFIGLAAMIFGKWTPAGAFGASTLFGFTDSLQTRLQILGIPIPSEFLLMAPYLVTIVVLAGVVGRAYPPAADGQPYEK
ncbi:ABC transporter permease [Limnochorda pilosa]|uniref:ABC transporter permease n=1 Tax=Limnochorda pilosa TaxID=1555112 RepID=A0A0K2SK17_LIMPI|nr:ABC transporter permease [Limnochorda pilosa]BAS27169.1 ABC transporter permease [Limnochorda pilosa]